MQDRLTPRRQVSTTTRVFEAADFPFGDDPPGGDGKRYAVSGRIYTDQRDLTVG